MRNALYFFIITFALTCCSQTQNHDFQGGWLQDSNLDENYPCPDLIWIKLDSFYVYNECIDNLENLVAKGTIKHINKSIILNSPSDFDGKKISILSDSLLTLEDNLGAINYKKVK